MKGICAPSLLIADLFTITKMWKKPKDPSLCEWIKNCAVYIHNGIFFSHENGDPSICAKWMDPEDLMRSEMSGTEKDKYYLILLIYEA